MRILLILLFNLSWVSCSLIPSPNPKIKFGQENNELNSFEHSVPNYFDTLFADTLTNYLKTWDSVWAKHCGKEHKCHIVSSWKFKPDINQSLFLDCDCDKQPYIPPVRFIEGEADHSCYLRDFNVLYSPLTKDFFIANISELKNESKRYVLKLFLARNNMKLENIEMAFIYLYESYSTPEFSVRGSPYFYSINKFKQIPLPLVKYHDDSREFRIIRADYDLFQAEMEKALQKHQAEAKNYFCGAITGPNQEEGKWELYFFVVDERNPIDYEVYTFQTPARECYTWKGFGAYGGEYGIEDFLDEIVRWAK